MKRSRKIRELLYDINYLILGYTVKKLYKKAYFYSFEHILLLKINSCTTINEKMRVMWVIMNTLSSMKLHQKVRGKYYLVFNRNLRIQYNQILKEKNIRTREMAMRFVMKGWIPYENNVDGWIYHSYAYWSSFNEIYHDICRNYDESKCAYHEMEFRAFIVNIMNLRKKNHRREEMLLLAKQKRGLI